MNVYTDPDSCAQCSLRAGVWSLELANCAGQVPGDQWRGGGGETLLAAITVPPPAQPPASNTTHVCVQCVLCRYCVDINIPRYLLLTTPCLAPDPRCGNVDITNF